MIPNGWHGTDDELRRLRAAVEHNCTCTTGQRFSADETCSAHAVLKDERVLDHLLYVGRMIDRLNRAEWWSGTPGTASTLIDGN
jgi:hypothetical protein